MKNVSRLFLLLLFLQSFTPSAYGINLIHTGTGLKTIVIDPGHGGSDKGGEGKNGLLEKDVALEVSLSLRQMMLNNLKINVVMTRDGDYDLSLKKRTYMANMSKGDLLISIHTGSSYSRDIKGIRIYYLDYEEVRKEFMVSPSNHEAEADNNESGEDDVEIILRDMAISDFSNEGGRIAELIQKNLTEIIPDQNIILKSMPILIFRDVNMPSVMIEIGNITNPNDMERLKDRNYRDKVAMAILNAVKEYNGVNPVTQP
jgi:N-acetylmuramoyl-L-alanine amidase